ncbi:hypothetical protein ACVIGB_010295 [Bradyrhizobium sp. USDA 4341]
MGQMPWPEQNESRTASGMRAESSTEIVLASGAFFIALQRAFQTETRILPSTENVSSRSPNDQFVWGAAAIAPIIGRSEKGAFHALESGRVPGAKKVAGRWGLHLPTFTSHFVEPAAAA